MNVSKLIAGLRFELELVEASIQDFERLAKVRHATEALTTVEIRLPTNGNPVNLHDDSRDGDGIRKAG